eukprot:scaffold121940_cov31-Tisochrysis_lutea.AAC.1
MLALAAQVKFRAACAPGRRSTRGRRQIYVRGGSTGVMHCTRRLQQLALDHAKEACRWAYVYGFGYGAVDL